jgi:4-carboxymuconolactone decarboxylase
MGRTNMALVPFLDSDQISPEHGEIAEKVIGRILNFHKVVAHAPKALAGYLALSEAQREMKLDRKLRELAYLRTAQLNSCQYWIPLHIALGQRVGLTQAQLDGLASHTDNPDTYSALQHLVIRYAEQLTTSAHTDEALFAELQKYLTAREMVELTVTVATANATTRICNALKIEEEWILHRLQTVASRRAGGYLPNAPQRYISASTLAWLLAMSFRI